MMTEPGYLQVFPPDEAGWTRCDSSDTFTVQLQDFNDKYYRIPRNLIKGCFCKKGCGTRCSCKKDDDRANVCTPITCKHCRCTSDANEQYEEEDDHDDDDEEMRPTYTDSEWANDDRESDIHILEGEEFSSDNDDEDVLFQFPDSEPDNLDADMI